MEHITKKLVSILQGDSTLQTLLGGSVSDKKIYPVIPDQFETFPCITYDEIMSPENTIPKNTVTQEYAINVFVKTTKSDLEAIATRVRTLLRYYAITNPVLYLVSGINAFDNNSTDRQLFSKVIRFTVYSKTS